MTTHATPPTTDALDSPASSGPRSGTDSTVPTRASVLAFATVLAMAVSVFVAFDALPFQDLPAHAGLIALRERIVAASAERAHYVYAPHVGPYSLSFRFLGGAC